MSEAVDRSMTTDALVELLVGYGRANDVESLADASPYLEELAASFGGRRVREITARELHDFHGRVRTSPAVGPLLDLLEAKAQRWESAYQHIAQGGWAQWQSERPVSALVEVFGRSEIEPARVLEIGCGDGVNAVFMASRGCAVTAVDLSSTALELAADRARAAGVELTLVEGDVFELDLGTEQYDFVFDRGMFHHVQVFHFEDYKERVAGWLVPGGHLHLICHHVSTRPSLLLDCLCGFVGKLLSFLSGTLVEVGTGFTEGELREVFSDRFRVEAIDVVPDDNDTPLRFLSTLLVRTA